MVMSEGVSSGREGRPSPGEHTGAVGNVPMLLALKGLLTSWLRCPGVLTLWSSPLSPGCAEGYARDATEIQNIQIADGDICRSLSVPLYMVFPRLFTCPTLETTNFKVGKQSTPGLQGPQHSAFGYSPVRSCVCGTLQPTESPLSKPDLSQAESTCVYRRSLYSCQTAVCARLQETVKEGGLVWVTVGSLVLCGRKATTGGCLLSSGGAHDRGDRDECWYQVCFLDCFPFIQAKAPSHGWCHPYSRQGLPHQLNISRHSLDDTPRVCPSHDSRSSHGDSKD